MPEITAALVVDLHHRCLASRHWPRSPVEDPPADADVWFWIERNHRCNGLLWVAEDEARRTDVPEREIVRRKREIDCRNQQRNDAVERIDEHVLTALEEIPRAPEARQHSETVGAMIDRLSILALKIHHMRLESQRDEAGAAHVARCAERVAILREQRADLAACLNRLLGDAWAGQSYFKIYRQFKMYNDPQLNPALYRAAEGADNGPAREAGAAR